MQLFFHAACFIIINKRNKECKGGDAVIVQCGFEREEKPKSYIFSMKSVLVTVIDTDTVMISPRCINGNLTKTAPMHISKLEQYLVQYLDLKKLNENN